MLAPLQNYSGGEGLAPRSLSSYAYAVYPTFTFLQIQFVWPQYNQRERVKERKRERVNDENYHEKRERERETEREMQYIQMYREIRSERQKTKANENILGKRELTNILNKKMLKYHFLFCIYIYIKFQKMFHSSFFYIFFAESVMPG